MEEFDTKLLLKRLSEGMIPMHTLLGVELHDVQDGFVAFKLPFHEKLIGDFINRKIHGGVISAVMDAVGGAVGILNFKAPEDQLSTINIHVNYLLPTTDKDMIFEARSIKNGSRVIFTEMKAFHVGEEDKIVATGTAAYSFKPKSAK